MATRCAGGGDTWSTIGSRGPALTFMNLQAKLTRCSSLRIRQSKMIAFFLVEGGLIYLDKPENGGFAAYEDGFTFLELTRKHYREAGLDVRKLNLLVR
jgi:hypothetical protein